MKKNKTCGWWSCGHQVGIFLATLFVLCFAWYWLRGAETSIAKLHFDSLRLAFFGFRDFGFGSFLAGLIQSYIWGYIFSGAWIFAGHVSKDHSCEQCAVK